MEAGYPFQYLLVLDFEATCEDGQQMQPCSEIIEFPVRVIKLTDNHFLPDIFHHYVKPKYNPVLTPFCINLTGITQEVVDTGLPLQEVIAKFQEWVKKYQDTFMFVTCGRWDLNTCLHKQAKAKDIPLPAYFRKYINIKEIYPNPEGWKKKKRYRPSGMTEMLDNMDLELEGRHHSGIDDTLNIGRVMIQLIKGGLKITAQDIHHVNPQ